MKPLSVIARSQIVITAFALGHSLLCLLFHNTSFGDGIILTVLTIAMVDVLLKLFRVPFDTFLGIAFLSCFAGFYIGTQGALLIGMLLPGSGVLSNVLATFLTTEILGNVILFIVRKSPIGEKLP